jgi:hypothetical protein
MSTTKSEVEDSEAIERAMESGALLERQRIRVWIDVRRRRNERDCDIAAAHEDEVIIELLENGEYPEDSL